ncbi:hypothetical protein Nepgr_019477 [Nepenthes gracilis]|uniref:Uncharacterized protein n=1 Tax=Nepenthes gracilis TaxID=150966 RepID=A0AAD3SVE3_NEPGR|nr:hypothetical protein Nepgr_019477 [Nepenthes gracilis]
MLQRLDSLVLETSENPQKRLPSSKLEISLHKTQSRLPAASSRFKNRCYRGLRENRIRRDRRRWRIFPLSSQTCGDIPRSRTNAPINGGRGVIKRE